ncbi:MAG: hypothetical protein E7F13_07740, partial [Megasphaera sp.]|nr:hypothetical protein [Megasphaera sp.]
PDLKAGQHLSSALHGRAAPGPKWEGIFLRNIAGLASKRTKKEDSSLSKPQNKKPVKMNPLCDWISISILGADVNKKRGVLR